MSSINSGHNPKGRRVLMERLKFLGQMGSTETALFHQKVAETFGMGITDMKTISTLMQEGPMTAGQIGHRLSLTTGAVTNLIDRLESKGVVKRSPDPLDRRKIIVTADAQMLKRGGHAYDSIGKAYTKLLDNYSDEELQFLISHYEKQIELTKQQIANLAKNNNKPNAGLL